MPPQVLVGWLVVWGLVGWIFLGGKGGKVLSTGKVPFSR